MLYNQIFVNKKTIYHKTLEKIMKNYVDIIVSVDECPNLDDYEILKISDFDDMVDVEEEFKSPILCYEKIEGHETWFIITNDKYAYVYVLNQNSIQ